MLSLYICQLFDLYYAKYCSISGVSKLKKVDVLFPYKQALALVSNAHVTYIFPIALSPILRFFLNPGRQTS